MKPHRISSNIFENKLQNTRKSTLQDIWNSRSWFPITSQYIGSSNYNNKHTLSKNLTQLESYNGKARRGQKGISLGMECPEEQFNKV